MVFKGPDQRCVVSEYGLREGVLVHLARSCRAHP